MNYAIVTGVSKGLGASTAKYLLESGIHVIGISRTDNDALYLSANDNDVQYEHISCDLGNTDELMEVIAEIKKQLQQIEINHLYLVNNAAVVEPINTAEDVDPKVLQMHYQLNVLAPMMLMNACISICQETTFIGVNISSGAAERSIYGWSAYCSAKASINRYTETVALEQNEKNSNHKVIAFNPGIMDTAMQEKIRATDSSDFKDVATFQDYKKANLLSKADVVASVLVDILTDEVNIENGKIYSVTDYV